MPGGAQRRMKMCYATGRRLPSRADRTWCCEPGSQTAPDAVWDSTLCHPAPAGKHAQPYLLILRHPASPSSSSRRFAMNVLFSHCAGLEVHKKWLVACMLTADSERTLTHTVRSFGTLPADLLALADWLHQAGVTHVVLESTSEFWK